MSRKVCESTQDEAGALRRNLAGSVAELLAQCPDQGLLKTAYERPHQLYFKQICAHQLYFKQILSELVIVSLRILSELIKDSKV